MFLLLLFLCPLGVDFRTVVESFERNLRLPFTSSLVTISGLSLVDVAPVLLEHCPDAPYRKTNGYTCLHHAVQYEQTEFVKFVPASPQLHRLINMRDEDDETLLHLAVKRCYPKMVEAFLHHQDIDVTVLNDSGVPPIRD
jgi:ankyrin repeat protein